MGYNGYRGCNLDRFTPVRMTSDMREVVEIVAQSSGCTISDVIRICVEASFATTPTAPLALKQLQRNFKNGGTV